MVRFAALIALMTGLAACQQEAKAPSAAQPVVSTQNTNDTRIAKQVFGNIPSPAAMPEPS